MADKEATVYIVDLGESMADCHNGRTESDLDFGMRYVWDKISTTVAASRKTWTVGVVGLNTEETDNAQEREGLEGYDHISVLQEIGPMTMSSLRELRSTIQPSHNYGGDAISAIVVALSMIEVFTKKLKYNRRIILVTNGESPIDDESSEDVANRLNDSNIELVVIGIDFDDAEYGFKEEDKSSTKAKNEKILRKLVDHCSNGVFGTMAQAVEELAIPRIKSVRPFKAYDGPLTLGDPSKYESALSIHVERYFKTKRALPPPASTVVVNHEHGGLSQSQTLDGDTEMGGTEFSGVKHMRTYRVNDPDAPGGKRDVDFEDLAKGYQYGRTVVPFSESDFTVTKLETKKMFTILGFVPFSSYEPFLDMGESGIVVAQKHNEEAELALSALIHALHELESYAVARYVQKDDAQPQIFLLKPNPGIEDEFECLYDVPLPFAEDVRSYQFPPLDKVLTVTGNVLKEHRLLPSEDLKQAMSDFVDSMDLSTSGEDDEGKPVEYAPIDDLYNPIIHRMTQAIRARAVDPEAPIGPPAEILLRYSRPPEKLIDKAKPEIEVLIDAAEIKKVPAKAQGRRGRKEQVKPLSGLDIDSLLGESKRTTISMENSIPEFKQTLATATDDATVERAVKQMGEIVRKLIHDSFADLFYARAAENLRVMREELIGLEFPALYNKFLTALKKSILSGELNGDRREMWFKHIIGGHLSLITQDESEVSEVAEDEAKAFAR
ncbi:ATP-dependent DNA helicase II subunit 2 [Madurella mycetomatis]|uniref:ATP-dependent DNA helicase II subunit 2 n=1 Tax=Madurella mycetomatis TaxID=100816 RepID=A0A175VRH7_9PEZI|nr:ATP-dependent DNA helicase II subunit 2 [Madurella mycetomatis]KXX79917.1 ATP-dependent DNA helicase II subunit 2 [Madurella mycetomatis]